MLIACWSPKGGSGTTVVATALALLLAESAPAGAVLADLAGDVPAALGLPEPTGPGLAEWLRAGDDVDGAALGRIATAVSPSLSVLAVGAPALRAVFRDPQARGDALAAALSTDPRPVVADCGTVATGDDGALGAVLAARAAVSFAVLRPCYLALRRALAAPVRPSGVVLLTEPGRALGRSDVEAVLGVPVRADVEVDPAVARAVDAGLLATRLPARLARALRAAA